MYRSTIRGTGLALVCSVLTGATLLVIQRGADRRRNHIWADPHALLSFLVAYFLLGKGLKETS